MTTASNLTVYHAKYFAHELTKRCASDSVEKLATALSNAQVDLNPHQIEASLFAFRSPLSKGAILADEVGLGKTIEAGILLAQHWAEQRRTLLVICPANLRKQWSQELRRPRHFVEHCHAARVDVCPLFRLVTEAFHRSELVAAKTVRFLE